MYWDSSQHIHLTGMACRASNGNSLSLPFPGAPSVGLQEYLNSKVTSEERMKWDKCSLEANIEHFFFSGKGPTSLE